MKNYKNKTIFLLALLFSIVIQFLSIYFVCKYIDYSVNVYRVEHNYEKFMNSYTSNRMELYRDLSLYNVTNDAQYITQFEDGSKKDFHAKEFFEENYSIGLSDSDVQKIDEFILVDKSIEDIEYQYLKNLEQGQTNANYDIEEYYNLKNEYDTLKKEIDDSISAKLSKNIGITHRKIAFAVGLMVFSAIVNVLLVGVYFIKKTGEMNE